VIQGRKSAANEWKTKCNIRLRHLNLNYSKALFVHARAHYEKITHYKKPDHNLLRKASLNLSRPGIQSHFLQQR
jgi:hypothetical protein